MCDSSTWCILPAAVWQQEQPLRLLGAVLAEYTLSEATEPKKADYLGGAVFICARNSPIVFSNVLFMGVTVCACLTAVSGVYYLRPCGR